MGEPEFVQIVLVTWPRLLPYPYMVKTLKNLLFRNQKADDLETWYTALGAGVLPSLFSDDPGLTMTYFTAMSNLVPFAFVWEKGKTVGFFRNYCRLWFETSKRRLKWHKVSVDIKTLSPWGCIALAPGLYTCIRSWKKMYKIRRQRDFFETFNEWVKR